MDFSTAISIIRKDLEEARSFLDQLASTPGIPEAELELARSRIRSAVELLTILPKLKEDTAQPDSRHEDAAPVPAPEKMISQIPEMKNKPGASDKNETMTHTMKEEPKAEAAQNKTPEAGKSILADKFSSQNRIGEQITNAKQDEVIASVMSLKTIDDISTAIGINDKFYFIRELFSGDSKAYHDTIRRLNSASSLGEAMKILDDSTIMGSDPAAQSAFVDVVRRKFNLNV